MTGDTPTTHMTKLEPPLGFDFEGWPAILIAIGEDTAVLHIEDEDHEIAAAKLPADIRRKAHSQLDG